MNPSLNLWTLEKDGRTLVCELLTQPGTQKVIQVYEIHRTITIVDQDELLVTLPEGLKRQAMAQGWGPPAKK